MKAARAGGNDLASQYLNTKLGDKAASELARQLFVVLDSRLPPRLTELSDRPEGSLADPLKPDQDVVGTITTNNGPLDLVLERVNRGVPSPVWLFSRQTLEGIPEASADSQLVALDPFLPPFLTKHRIGGIRLFEWLALALIIPACYPLTGLLGRLLRPFVVTLRRRHGLAGHGPDNLMPGAIRLFVLAVAIRWIMSSVELSLIERQFWWAFTAVLAIAAVAWALLLLNGIVEGYIHRRLWGSGHSEIGAMLRLVRRIADALVLAACGIVTLEYFGVDPTAALAGLGIGGIAVALAAQKTLENVVGGISIIVDQAVRVGDSLKLGDSVGIVDSIGLRSTRIRTLDRTILSVPNGQIANVNIETLSARDKVWFHHYIGLRYETTTSQLGSLIEDFRAYLITHPKVDRDATVRVRLVRLGPFSIDVEIVAYLACQDWEAFLETQQQLLIAIIDMVEHAGAELALPSQTLHMADGRQQGSDAGRIDEPQPARPIRRSPDAGVASASHERVGSSG